MESIMFSTNKYHDYYSLIVAVFHSGFWKDM